MRSHPLLSKFVAVTLLAMMLLIPLNMIESKIDARQSLQHDVQQDIARSSAGPQTLNGPYLVVKYRLRWHRITRDGSGNQKTVITESGTMEKRIPASTLKIDGNAGVKTRHRGIYTAQLFNLDTTLSGTFDLPADYGIGKPPADIIPVSLDFSMGISDARGIMNAPVLTLNGDKHGFAQGAGSTVPGNGIHVRLPLPDMSQAHHYDFSFPFSLQGMNTLSVVPAGDNTEMSLTSTWPHPSFGGDFLPRSHTIDNKGFGAQWKISSLGHNLVSNEADPALGLPAKSGPESFSVGFIDPVNIYLLSERAVKYGILFVVLVFTAFFMFEIMRDLNIHPMQYLLVGLALAIFFLLIISLSEHIPFLAAYALSAAACSLLIGAYLAGVLRNRKLGTGFGAGIALLYAVLYGVLQSEDNALLMGSTVLFAALAAVMMLTRRIDWYQFEKKALNEPA